ncbi:AbrB family transcriptional regulator [Flavimaricola marinus]|uniref:Putative ammonia monooxygenase n=1 Tax=Flavimaricola marinus TaxID=1819565 RepID=A0A238LHV1_9RHOB|nr:AbrB family transcriptional regulator [Flavimaricola marinus]SMY09123.1 Putative ammonia monooxygenase [Flavimaricola marinus]
MMSAKHVGWTLLAGAVGASAFTALGVPAGSLIGASLAVALLGAIAGIGQMPERLRDLAFVVIGLSLGGGIDTRFGEQVAEWALSLGFLVVSLAATLALGAWVLSRLFGFDRQTAVLATCPGTMSNVIALGIEGRGDVTAIMTLQVLRLLVLVTLVPPVASYLEASPVDLPVRDFMGLGPLAVLMLAAYAVGLFGQRIGVPAACLLAGLLLSGSAHATGVIHGAVPDWVVFAGFALTGATLGTRITKVGLRSLSLFLRAGSALMVVTLSVSLIFAYVTASVSGLPLAEVWIAFAPGGVEAMAAIGLSLGYDPAFVALHHFVRILALVLLLPLALGRKRGGA